MSYDTIRHFADSWALVAMFVFFVGVTLFVFRPGSRKQYEEAARIPLKNGSED
ncbi:MAG: cbb3-type cytochrome c oxidase subunit 3 [Alphaproteobacteria bacterium]|nr:cbb3-type cytochrome c oxidase subunit 3 [Alphaproteobacteria bacterium]